MMQLDFGKLSVENEDDGESAGLPVCLNTILNRPGHKVCIHMVLNFNNNDW